MQFCKIETRAAGCVASPPRSSRRGFTLVEILVVVAIIGVLVALLLPAVMKARESARVTQCKSQLKQVGLGCLTHEATYRALPSNGGEVAYGVSLSWINAILPSMDVVPLEAGLDEDELVAKLATFEKQFYCPSRRSARAYPWNSDDTPAPLLSNKIRVAGKTDYAGNGGTGQYALDRRARGRAASAIESGEMNNGVLNPVPVELRDIKDGKANTFLVGEKAHSPSRYETGEYGDHGSYLLSTALTVTSNMRFGDRLPSADSQFEGKFTEFGSVHPGAWNVVMCDGSVRSMDYSLSLEIIERYSNKSDGQKLTAAAEE